MSPLAAGCLRNNVVIRTEQDVVPKVERFEVADAGELEDELPLAKRNLQLPTNQRQVFLRWLQRREVRALRQIVSSLPVSFEHPVQLRADAVVPLLIGVVKKHSGTASQSNV